MTAGSDPERFGVRRSALVGAGIGALGTLAVYVPAILEWGEARITDPLRATAAVFLFPAVTGAIAGFFAWALDRRTPGRRKPDPEHPDTDDGVIIVLTDRETITI